MEKELQAYGFLMTGFVQILENLENTGILYLKFQALNILEFHQRSWKILEFEPVFGAVFLPCLYL